MFAMTKCQTKSRLMRRRGNAQKGVALPIALLLMTMLMGMGIAMVLAVSSDLFINNFYRNNRAAYYGADAGINIARQNMQNRLIALAPATFPAGTPPIAPGAEAPIQAAVMAQYNNYGSIAPAPQPQPYGSPVASWDSRFRVENLQLALIANPPQPEVTSVGPTGQPTGYRYTYAYTITTLGRSGGAEEIRLQESGTLTMNAAIIPAGGRTVSFASWGFFVDDQQLCTGSTLVPGTVTGPVHTNGGWTFGTSGSYIFTDAVTQSNRNMGFQFSNACLQSSTAPVSRGGTTINPTFQAGMTTNSPTVALPQNDFSQQRAVLDGMGTNTAAVTNAERNAELKLVNGTAYPAAGTPASGVYIPYSTDPVTGQAVVTGSGIHVSGNASVVMSTVGASGQRFQITQGGTTTTVTVDPVANTTVISQGGTTKTLQGVFMDLTTTPKPATMLYVDGSITSIRGPAQNVAAIQDGAAVTVTAKANVTVTGDLIYKTPVVTKTANAPCCPGAPAGTLIPGADNGQVLGVFTATGDIQLNNGNANGVLNIDASLATISNGGSGGLVNVGARINTLNISGGRIQNDIKNINTTTRNVLFDRRFATGFAPSWFPSTTINPPGLSAANYTTTAQRIRWFNDTQK